MCCRFMPVIGSEHHCMSGQCHIQLRDLGDDFKSDYCVNQCGVLVYD